MTQMKAAVPMTVIEYVTEEVSRQGHDVHELEGIERVGWMLEAWSYALGRSAAGERLFIDDILAIGSMIERHKNKYGFRKVGVRVGRHVAPKWAELPRLIADLFREEIAPLDFYRKFEEVHPFVDGNGRTGKVLLNWLNGTLLNPIFPSDDFWGHPIRNP